MKAPRARGNDRPQALAGALEDEEEAQRTPPLIDERDEAPIARQDETEGGSDDAIDVLALHPSRTAGPKKGTGGRRHARLVVVRHRRHRRTRLPGATWVAVPFTRPHPRRRSLTHGDVGGQPSQDNPMGIEADARRDAGLADGEAMIDLRADPAADVDPKRKSGSVRKPRSTAHGACI
jgi:hypothetical protein